MSPAISNLLEECIIKYLSWNWLLTGAPVMGRISFLIIKASVIREYAQLLKLIESNKRLPGIKFIFAEVRELNAGDSLFSRSTWRDMVDGTITVYFISVSICSGFHRSMVRTWAESSADKDSHTLQWVHQQCGQRKRAAVVNIRRIGERGRNSNNFKRMLVDPLDKPNKSGFYTLK